MNRSFTPPPRILLGPGPSDVSERVLQAVARPTIGHLDPEFTALMDSVADLLRETFLTRNRLTLPISAPGSAGMEACFVNLVEPDDRVLVCINGVFGKRMVENVQRVGAEVVVVEQPWGMPVDVEAVRAALASNPDVSTLAFVHAETSTGALSDAEALAQLAHEHDCLVIADCVTSLAGNELKVDDWGLDAVYSGTQKCLSCLPGLSPLTMSEAALRRIQQRSTKVQSWFLDLGLVMDYWDATDGRVYHHTAPVNAIYALHEALLQLHEEGLQQSWARHLHHHRALAAGLEAMGFAWVVPESSRLPQLNAVYLPEGVDDARVRATLLDEFGLEIGAGLGPLAGKVWRIGLMGSSSCERNVMTCLSALESVLQREGQRVQGADAAAEYYRLNP